MKGVVLLFILWTGLLCPVSAGLSFETTEKRYVAKPHERIAVVEFAFKNDGTKTLALEKIETGCTCMSGVTDQPRYKPGERGILRMEYKLGTLKGKARKSVTLHLSNGERQMLLVEVEVPELLRITPRVLKWQVGESFQKRSFRIEISPDSPMSVTRVTSTSEDFEIELKQIETQRFYEVEVTPKKKDKAAYAMLRIETDSKIKRFQLNQVFVVINQVSKKR